MRTRGWVGIDLGGRQLWLKLNGWLNFQGQMQVELPGYSSDSPQVIQDGLGVNIAF